MKYSKFCFFLFIIFLSLVRSAFAATPARDTDSISLQLKWLHQFQFAGYYAAQLKGYYQEEGLNVAIVQGSAHRMPISSVLEGNAQYGVAASDLLDVYAQGAPVVAIAVIFQHSPYILMSLKDKHISTPSDLIGKKVMAAQQQGWVQIKAMFLKEGIDSGSVRVDPHSWNIEDLITGKTDAQSAYITTEPYQVWQRGYDVNVIRPIDYGVDFYGDLLFTTQQEIKKYPERVTAFKRASLKGWEYAMTHVDEIADEILKMPGVKKRGITKAHLLYEAAEMQKLVLPGLIEIGHINPGRFEQMLNTYKTLKLVPQETSLKDFLYQPDTGISSAWIKFFSYLFIIAIIVSLFILVWNWQLRKEVYKRTLQLKKEHEQRHLAEEQARKTEDRLDLALKAAHLGIWDSDLQSGYVYRNDLWAEMLGYTPSEITPDYNGWKKLMHPDDEARVHQSIEDHISGKTVNDNYEHRLKTKNGDWKWILSLSKIVGRDERGMPSRLVGIHIDIDELKRKEIELQNLTHDLIKSNNGLEEFAYITSHNLRAPVVNLVSLMEMFKTEAIEGTENMVILEKASESIKRLQDTLNDLVEILSTRKVMQQSKTMVSFESVLVQVSAELESQIRATGTGIDYHFELSPAVYYHEKVLQNIFQHLLTNAIKYRHPERKARITLRTFDTSGGITLKFSDNGSGIDLERFGNKVFGLYKRFHHHTEGKGMGLYLVKHQIESMEGQIHIESKVNEGTTFTIIFKK